MTTDQLRLALKAEPFRPFVIHMASGRQLRVNHPEFVLQPPTGRAFVVWTQENAFDIIDGLLVESIEVPNGQVSAANP